MKITKRQTLDNADDQIVNYLKLLLEKKGMNILPPNLVADMLLDLYSRFEAYLLVSALEQIEPEKYAEFDALMEDEMDPDKGLEFIKNNLPNYKDVTMGAMAEFEKTYLGE
jgi:hypothetical protein